MNKQKALQLFNELKTNCPGLILSGSVLRGKQDSINNLDLIWVGKIFPIHLLPLAEMESVPNLSNPEILQFTYKGEQVYIYRADKDKLGARILHLTGPKEYSIFVRTVAKKKGFRLNQYGLFKGDQCIASKTEKEILNALGLKHLEPAERNRFKSITL